MDTVQSGPTTALAFAFDARFLSAFKVILGSKFVRGTLLTCPIIVMTPDQAVPIRLSKV